MLNKRKLTRYFISDKKRFGLKYTIGDNILRWISVVIGIGGAIGFFYFAITKNTVTNEYSVLFLCVMALSILASWNISIDVMKRRIRELDGDILKDKDNLWK